MTPGTNALRRLWHGTACGLAFALSVPAEAQFFPPDDPPPRRDCPDSLATDALADCLLTQMTLAEKARYVSGTGFESNGVARLGIAPFRMSDGPKGVRTDGYPATTAFPGGVSLAATWNPALVARASAAMGEEARALGVSVLLGPGINIQRYPLGGRNFEYYSEDPRLSGEIGTAWVRGIQAKRVAATPKHFAVNNQETNRFWNNSVVDERTMREIYFPQFEQVVREAQPWTIMSSYNRINGTFASHDRWLLTDVLRREWGFDGAVISDWTALHDTAAGMNAGMDLEMPNTKYYGPLLADAVQIKEVELATLDESVRRLLRLQMRTGTLRKALVADPASPLLGSQAHLDLARAVAAESLVLLRNEGGLLPLRKDAKIAFIGPNVDPTTYQCAGSSEVTATRRISVRDGVVALRGEQGSTFTIGSANDTDIPAASPSQFVTAGGESGLVRRYWSNAAFTGDPLETRRDTVLFAIGPENHDPANALNPRAVSWDGRFRAVQAGEYRFNSVGYGAVRLLIDGKVVLDGSERFKSAPTTFFGNAMPVFEGRVVLAPGLHDFRFERVLPEAGSTAPVNLFRFGAEPPVGTIAAAAQAAREADVAVVVVGLSPTAETEGSDRKGIALPGEQDALVEAVVAANPRTVVVVNAGGPVLMPWADKVPAIIEAWYPGQEGGFAVGDALFGRVNPSGKLPVTFPLRLEDSPAFPYAANARTAFYGDGVFVGYRGFDKRAMPVLFPFGHGLSYTTFAFADLDVPATAPVGNPVSVSFKVTNTGAVEGAEVAQVYVRQIAPSEPRPIRELKGFRKVLLDPGRSTNARLELTPRDFAFWDAVAHAWRIEPGDYEIEVGNSSRDVRLKARLRLEGDVALLAPDDATLWRKEAAK